MRRLSVFPRVLASCLALLLTAAVAAILVLPWLGEGPFAITIENGSGERVVVRMKQVGATAGTVHPLEPRGAASPSWGSCALTEVVVSLRRERSGGRRDPQVVSRQRFDICDGDRFVVGEDFRVTLECAERRPFEQGREYC